MSFNDILGQDEAKKILRSGLRKDSVNHAYLFDGPSGSGQMKTALTFAQALFCTEMKDDACGKCLECRKVEHGNHPDLILINPDGASIKIDQIRGLQRVFSYRSESNNPKVYIIDHADTMTNQASNSLLRFLEEPPIPAVAILIAENVQALLPTIQSRSQRVSFHPLSPTMMLQLLINEGYPSPLVRCAVHLSSGLEGCRELLEQNWFAEIRNVVLQLGKESMGRGSTSLITAGTKLFKAGLSEHLDILFNLFHLWFKDMLHVQYERHESIVFIDQLEYLTSQASSRSDAQWISYMDLAAEAKKKLRYNVNGQLCLEQFLMGLED
ncbi:DNA polymerase III subunit delta' [Paenibacillus macquariensis]|uniref:DNA polymerase-3 subunit delta n=1 Tax=Paenibacillus macquariensis TaxID=948756 RepID=A0ABY1KCL4_9BACL|nr:DNA polymerase III subunit delta' [Paenibacillus macquariensis]MEC0094154.1 DNA polymerase III subunit delta' [Paenibacillus macquariensis]OAB26177.1 ATPase [Paenibacillus macquariensis subsp. macquariensis]SIR60756.1 DNA polymerase-3 subunit delta' [Paenibacillus macquariensis]